MPPLRVLHTVASLAASAGGPSRSVPALASALRAREVETEVYAWDSGRRLQAPLPSLYHDHGLWLFSNHRVAAIARRAGIPRVVSVRGMMEPWALRHRSWKKRIAWNLYQRRDLEAASVIHVTSEAEARHVRQRSLLNPIAIVPNAVSIPAQLPPKHERPVRRALFMSRLHPIKGAPMLLEAWNRVRPQGWELVVAGPDEGGHLRELKAIVRQLDLTDSVRFRGSASDDEKWLLLRTADLFVLPTHSENFGLVVAEALAAEVPVITTKGAPWEKLVSDRCGWWPAAEAGALASAIMKAVELTESERRAMGARGRQLVEREYTWPKVAGEILSVYLWVLHLGPRPGVVHLD